MKSINLLKVYEAQGVEAVRLTETPIVAVESHWGRHDLVVLKIGQMEVTVLASELKKATDNSTNH